MKKPAVLDRTFLDAHIRRTESGCWEWTRSINVDGYGDIRAGGGQHRRYAHRFAYELLVGPIPDGLELDHLCRNRCCCNPAHLEPVTHAENMRRGSYGSRTHCIRGHEFTPENTYVQPKTGHRYCKACIALRQRQYRAQRKAVA